MNLQEYPTSYAEHPMNARSLAPFGIRCWMFDIFHWFRGSNARMVSGNSLPVFIAHGDADKNRAFFSEHKLTSPVLLQRETEAAKAY